MKARSETKAELQLLCDRAAQVIEKLTEQRKKDKLIIAKYERLKGAVKTLLEIVVDE